MSSEIIPDQANFGIVPINDSKEYSTVGRACGDDQFMACIEELPSHNRWISIISVIFIKMIKRALWDISHISYDMRVNHRCLNMFMAQQILYFSDINPVH
jgi:hypothetical protein